MRCPSDGVPETKGIIGIDAHQPHIIEITDLDDDRLLLFSGLRDRSAHHIARGSQLAGRLDEEFIIAEGVFILQTLVETGHTVVAVLTEPARVDEIRELAAGASGSADQLTVFVADRSVLSGIVGYPFHRGVIALARRAVSVDAIELARRSSALVMLENLANHENVGSIFRTVAALGGQQTGIIVNEGCTDPMYRRSVRVSMGHALRQPFAVVDDLVRVIGSLRDEQYLTVALAPASSVMDSPSYVLLGDLSRLLDGRKPALVFGSEAHGLTQEVIDACDRVCSIPMASGVDSLNVNVSVGVVLASFAGSLGIV